MDNSHEQEPKQDESLQDEIANVEPTFKDGQDVAAPGERFSLEMLGQEQPQENIELVPEEKKQLYEALAKQNSDHRKGLESILESKNLAEVLIKYDEINPEFLKNFLEIKKDRGLFGEHNVEELTRELLDVEAKIIAPLVEKLKNNDFNLTQEQIDSCITGAREAFYGMVINERLSAKKIEELLGGGISVSKEPGSEISQEHQHMENIAAYLKLDKTTNKFGSYIYEGLFRENNKDIAFLFRHEFFHAAAFAVWGQRYSDFREAAKNPESNIAAFEDIPELQEVLIMVANPETAKPFFREYIANLLDAIDSAESEEHKAFYRRQAAIEIVADLGAHFLEGSKTSDVLLDLRARYFKENPEQLIKTMCQLEGVEDKDELFERYSINPEETPPQEIISRLSESKKLRALFKSSEVWQTELTKRFENRGENLNLPNFDTEEESYGMIDEIELTSAVPRQPFGLTSASRGSGEQKTPAQAVFDFLDFVIGKKTA
jgi:hypothetical protein